ncbi:MAG: UDP-N-acetylmuramate dehydrogenase [Patescibacteria group bacterium]
MEIQKNIKLAKYTTFKIGGPASFFCIVKTDEDLVEAITFAQKEKQHLFVLGGGSNILIHDRGFNGLVIKMCMEGIEYDGENVRAAAGEGWDDLVDQAVTKGLYGLENLSAIPGTVGAAPVQNIGAYGAEASNTIVSVRAFDIKNMKFVELTNEECTFSYRDSLFKHEKGRYIITCVNFKLSREPKVNTSYKEVREYLAKKNIVNPTPEDIRHAVIEIRWGKLPDWKLWGTAGSFFKNPVVNADHFSKLRQTFPDLPGFPEDDGRVKVSLGWILDKVCHVKGLCVGNVCTYEKQALVLVSRPGATSEEVVKLAHELMDTVKEKTGIEIEGEVEWVN